jgi:ferric-dicitrate binding protein FerR (iron transport regulator)
MSTPATPPRTVPEREAKPEAQPSGPKRRRHAAMMMVLLAILVLLWVVEAYLRRAGYLMPLPPML